MIDTFNLPEEKSGMDEMGLDEQSDSDNETSSKDPSQVLLHMCKQIL